MASRYSASSVCKVREYELSSPERRDIRLHRSDGSSRARPGPPTFRDRLLHRAAIGFRDALLIRERSTLSKEPEGSSALSLSLSLSLCTPLIADLQRAELLTWRVRGAETSSKHSIKDLPYVGSSGARPRYYRCYKPCA